jgi:parallel beta-helix repeat protein
MNTASSSRIGFLLDGSTNNTLIKDTANSNADGFGINFSGNSLKLNIADNNSQYGYEVGFGAVNTYFKNECIGNLVGGSSPTGLCTPRT